MPATQVSKSQCIELQSNPGYYLLRDAAYAWDRSCAAFGKVVIITGAWRSYETQLRLFDSEQYPESGRYVRGNRAGQRGFTNDVRWWPAKASYWTRKEGTAAAAVPGTSNHGGGIAVDVKTKREKGDPPYAEAVIFASFDDADRLRFLRVAKEHGWDDDEGRGIGELWHLTYYPDRDQHRGRKPTATIQEEPDMDATQAKQLSTIHSILTTTFADEGDRDRQVTPHESWRRGLALDRRIYALVSQNAAPAIAKAVTAAVTKALPDVDRAAITAAVTDAVDEAMASVEITLTPKEN